MLDAVPLTKSRVWLSQTKTEPRSDRVGSPLAFFPRLPRQTVQASRFESFTLTSYPSFFGSSSTRPLFDLLFPLVSRRKPRLHFTCVSILASTVTTPHLSSKQASKQSSNQSRSQQSLCTVTSILNGFIGLRPTIISIESALPRFLT